MCNWVWGSVWQRVGACVDGSGGVCYREWGVRVWMVVVECVAYSWGVSVWEWRSV